VKISLILLALVFTLLGCARFPANFQPDATRVVFRMTVRGQIRSDYVYVFPIRTSTDPNPIGDGPIPTLQFPTSNGFVEGHVQYFVLWTPDTQQYTLYKFTDSTLTFYNAVGTPLNPIDVTPGSRTLGFELSLEQLVDTPGTSKQLQVLQVNFLTMNKRLDQSNGSTRIIDCLGNTNLLTDFNEPVKIPLATTGLYDNARFNFLEPLEPDCPDPDLDISDWSVQVNRQ
jgi:hypothetical protein